MTTWQDSSSGGGEAVTEWEYHPSRGFLEKKVYSAPGTGGGTTEVSYTYTAAGRLKTRTSARDIVTTYNYTDAGELAGIVYTNDSVNTPPVTLTYDRLGHLSGVTDALGGPRLIEHNLFGSLEREESAFGPELELGYDSHNRLDSISVLPSGGGSPLTAYSLGYEPSTSRIAQIDYGDHAIDYGYHANSALIETVAFERGGALRLTTTRQYDNLNRLRAISSGAMSYAYSYNAANQRVAAELADGSKWSFAYDDRGQLTAGERRWVDGIPVEGQQFGYGFDDIGNRQFAVRNGQTAAYQADLLNRIEEREVPGAVEILGHAHPEAIVTVNQQNVTRQREGYFHHSLSVDNADQDVWQEVNIIGVRNGEGPNGEDVVSEVSGHAFVPADPEMF